MIHWLARRDKALNELEEFVRLSMVVPRAYARQGEAYDVGQVDAYNAVLAKIAEMRRAG